MKRNKLNDGTTNRPIELAIPVEVKIALIKARNKEEKTSIKDQEEENIKKYLSEKKERGPLISGLSLDNTPIPFMNR